jgi:hypothetical protein
VDPLIAPIDGADHREVGGATIDVVPVGTGRVKRVVYPAGFRWSKNMQPEVGTELCMHAHVGFLARGRIEGEYAGGSTFEYEAPAVIAIEPGHDAWVAGEGPAVVIEFDFESETAERFGLRPVHAQ